ncbi:oxidoreductase [Candidatus Pseudothioglobus singularis]|jgi:NAD(P)-dependent dehydrogenase (short-subunit alcohol dehydrogenase family)|nr:oxidoreductase [Candidatus Pseudothioglobus singularis]
MTIAVIGGSGRIGFPLIKSLIEKGKKVAIGDIDLDSLYEKLSLIDYNKENIFFKQLDINSEKDYISWMEDAESQLGYIQGAVMCAYPRGNNYGNTLEKVSLNDFNNNVSIHLGAYFNFLKNTSNKMLKKGGSIVCISSIYGHSVPKFEIYDNTDMTMPVEYAAAKSAINHLVKYFSKFYASNELRFNAVCPGGIVDNQPEEFKKAYLSKSLNKGLLETKDIIPFVEFLLEDKSSYINGQILTIDDGFTL